MKKLKISIIVFFIFIVTTMLIFNWFNQPKTIEHVDMKVYSPCDIVSPTYKVQCKMYEDECQSVSKTNDSAIFCLADKLSGISINFSANICRLLENSAIQNHCFAKVLSKFDLQMAKKQCGLIYELTDRVECNADILKEIDMSAALKECEVAVEQNQVYWCKAHIVAFKNETEGIEYCDKIDHQALRQLCYNEVKKAG